MWLLGKAYSCGAIAFLAAYIACTMVDSNSTLEPKADLKVAFNYKNPRKHATISTSFLPGLTEKQFVENVLNFACRFTGNDTYASYQKSSNCFEGENFTKQECEEKRCCYLREKETDKITCKKMQSVVYVYSHLQKLLPESTNGVSKKQSYSAYYINLITCIMNGGGPSCGQYRVTPAMVEPVVIPTLNYPIVTVATVPAQLTPVSTCFWYPWGAWNPCQGVCRTASQTRIRRCENCVPGSAGCPGSATMNRPCASPIGRVCGYWSGWSPYSECSSSCGDGIKTRTRSCYGGKIGDTGCIGSSSDMINCNTEENFGHYLPWTSWTTCPVSCGGSVQTRSQSHTCAQPINIEDRNCGTNRCCGKLQWSGWSPCSVTCGSGTRTRNRPDLCDDLPHEMETGICDAGSGNFGDWSPWGQCSQSCVGGVQRRERAHSCRSNVDYETQACGTVGSFGPWTGYGACSATCPGGEQVRTRRHLCTNEVQSDRQLCGQQGEFGYWSGWGECSTSCIGIKTRRRTHSCGLPPQQEQTRCGSNGEFEPWISWSLCSQTCIGGTQLRKRFNLCTKETAEENQPCGNRGQWGDYSSWTACSRSCGGGEQVRTRVHSCPSLLPFDEANQNRDSRICNTNICCTFGDWSMWSVCSKTCGYGSENRRQTNICEHITDRVETKYCLIGFGEWSMWSQWGDCSQVCPGGTRTRSRTQSCTNEEQPQSQLCGTDQGYNTWGKFSTCTKTCGGGFQVRTRRQICGIHSEEREIIPCNTNPGVFNDPGSWSACTRTCSGGAQTRVATHTCGMPARLDRRTCGSPGVFNSWGPWTRCSSTCMGQRIRRQTHQCSTEINSETEHCGSPGAFGSWQQWAACTQVCDGGTRTRRRFHSCGLPPEVDTARCGRQSYYGNWGPWGTCTRTCGGGTQSRTRSGFCGFSLDTEIQACGISLCCFEMPWTNWGACSVSCGVGQQGRIRYSNCSTVPVDNQVQACNAGTLRYNTPKSSTNEEPAISDVNKWDLKVHEYRGARIGYITDDCAGFTSEWTSWGECPVSCNGGRSERRRTNTCQDEPEVQTSLCSTNRCPFWSRWSLWSTCSLTCFEGFQVRRRECISGHHNMDCDGEDEQRHTCNMGDGAWNQWNAWSLCSASCGGGFYSRSRTHSCGLPAQNETSACNTHLGDFEPWTTWSQCTATCAGGQQTRQRTHSCTSDIDAVTRVCNTNLGTWMKWTKWSPCTATCGGGTYTRSRSHTCGLKDEVVTAQCNTFAGGFTSWTLWTACSATCENGFRNRRRSHSCGLEDQEDVERCNTKLCPYWSGWTEWSACSVTCFQGIRTRMRECHSGSVGQKGCQGESSQSESCDQGPGFFNKWSSFTRCSKTCNSGTQMRTRTHSCGKPEVETISCNTDPGQWANWEQWSACPVTCGGGHVSRRRSHTCGLDDEFETEACNIDPGTWTPWTPWTICSATCGFGSQTRDRKQTCTGERKSDSQVCILNPCAIWGGWTTWSPCTSSCGVGEATRQRICQGGTPNQGFCFTNIVGEIDTRKCDAGPCCEFDWSGWSACCRSEISIDIQLRFLGNGCGERWQIFNRTCPHNTPVVDIPCSDMETLFRTADSFRSDPARRRFAEFNLP